MLSNHIILSHQLGDYLLKAIRSKTSCPFHVFCNHMHDRHQLNTHGVKRTSGWDGKICRIRFVNCSSAFSGPVSALMRCVGRQADASIIAP